MNGNNVIPIPMESPKMPEFYNGHISTLCKRIKEGSKLEITSIHTKYVPDCKDIIRNNKLLAYAEKLDEEFSKIWIYAPSFYTLVLKEMLNLSDDTIQKIKPNKASIHQFLSKSASDKRMTAKVGDTHATQS
jgi:hypothetical protein